VNNTVRANSIMGSVIVNKPIEYEQWHRLRNQIEDALDDAARVEKRVVDCQHSTAEQSDGCSACLRMESERQLIAITAERDEETALRERLSKLLEGVANALKGPPDELTMHSWHDLPELMLKVTTELELLRNIEKAAREIYEEDDAFTVNDAIGKHERDQRLGLLLDEYKKSKMVTVESGRTSCVDAPIANKPRKDEP